MELCIVCPIPFVSSRFHSSAFWCTLAFSVLGLGVGARLWGLGLGPGISDLGSGVGAQGS